MNVIVKPTADGAVVYPESDGKPIADNTLQYRWIVTIHGNLDALFRDRPDVFVAADLLCYPVEGNPTISFAPDVMVAFGRPKGDRGSYRYWDEGGIAPQVVFEILSPTNTSTDYMTKLAVYRQYGVEEYYVYDPDGLNLEGHLRDGDTFRVVYPMNGWVSPRLGIRFEWVPNQEPVLYGPTGERFVTFNQLIDQRAQERQRAEQERQRAEQAERLAAAARERAERLAARLRAMGIDPDAVNGG